MVWFWVIVLIAIVGAIVVVVAGRGGEMADVYDDRPDATLPAGRPLTADDIRSVQLGTGFRGYRMDEVDALLQRIEADLLDRETGGTASRSRDVEPAPRHISTTDPAAGPAARKSRQEWGRPPAEGEADEARAAEPGDNWPYE